MDFRALRYIEAIARHQNLTRAAEALYVGQPTLSKFLAAQEAELGLKLFRKVGNRYIPTLAGERYLEKAAAILRLKDDLDAEMADILRRDTGTLDVAFAAMRAAYMLPTVLPAFQAAHPNVRVRVHEGSSDENDRRLLDGTAEVAFYSASGVGRGQIDCLPLAKEELLICTRKGHPLARQATHDPACPYPRLSLRLLQDERVLMMLPQQRTRQIVDAILHREQLCFENVLYTGNIQAITGLVAAGYGVSFVFDSHLKHCAEAGALDLYSFGQPRTLCDFVAATRRGSYVSDFAKDFIEIVRQSV